MCKKICGKKWRRSIFGQPNRLCRSVEDDAAAREEPLDVAARGHLGSRQAVQLRRVDQRHVVAEREGYVQVVCRKEDALPLVVRQAAQQQRQLVAVRQVEEGRGLVEQHDGRVLREGPGNHHALALAVRHAVHRLAGEGLHAREREGAFDDGPVGLLHAADPVGVGGAAQRHDILAGEVGDADLVRGDEGHGLGPLARRELVERPSAQLDAPSGGGCEPRNAPQQGALARAVAADEGRQRARGKRGAGVGEQRAAAVGEADMVQKDAHGLEEVAVADNDENHHRDAHQGGDGVDRQGEALRDEVADEQQRGAREHRSRKEDAVVGRREEHAREVGYGQPDEAHGAAESRDGACQQHRGEEEQRARALDVEPHRAGVVLAQQQQVQRLDDRHGDHQPRGDGREHECQLGGGDVAERAHRPDDERLECRLAREVLQHLDHRTDARTEHHAEDQDDHDVLDAAADGHDDQQHEGCAEPCRAGDAERLDERVARDAEQRGPEQEERDAQSGAGADAEDVGPGQRVAEERLHLESAGGEGRTGREGREGLEQAELQDDGAGRVVADAARQRRPHVAQRHGDRPEGEVGDEEPGSQQREQQEEQRVAGHGLFESFVVTAARIGCAVVVQQGDEVREHAVGPHDARLPEVGAAGGRLAAVVVPHAAVAHGGHRGEAGILGRQLGERVAGPDVEPDVGVVGQQVGLLGIDGHGARRVVLRVDVLAAGILDQADHVAARRGHEPRVAVGGVEHDARAGGRGVDLRAQRLVACRNLPQGVGARVAAVAEFGGEHQPLGLAQRRLLHVVTYIYIRNAQLAELARDDRVLARDAVEQHEVGPHGGQQLEVEVRVVAHVADRACGAAGLNVGAREVVDARDPRDAACLTECIEHRHVARRHADDAADGGMDGRAVESRGGLVFAAQHEQVLCDLRGSLPGVAHGNERACPVLRAADVETRGVAGRVELHGEIIGCAGSGGAAGDGQKGCEPGQKGVKKSHRLQK